MRQIIIKKSENSEDISLDIDLKMITFEGIINYREENRTAEALYYGITTENVLVPFYLPLQLLEGEDINSFSNIVLYKPLISSLIDGYTISGLIKKEGNDYSLQVSLPNEPDIRYIIKIGMPDAYIIAYTLNCIYEHSVIDIKAIHSLYNLYKEKYEVLKLSYLNQDDISIEKVCVDKSGLLLVLLSFYTHEEDKTVTNNHCLFMAELDKKQTRTLLKKSKSSIKFTDYNSFKELCTSTEEKVPVYLLEDPFVFNHETKKGNTLSRSIFVNHFYKKSVVFLEAEFNKFLSDLTERITNL